jgi:hypothetical protein
MHIDRIISIDVLCVKNYWVFPDSLDRLSGKIFTLPTLFAKVLELNYFPAEALYGGQ